MEANIWSAAHQTRTAHAVHGLVSAVDPNNHAVKVRIQPDDIETGWLPDMVFTQVGDLRISAPSAPGTHVLLMPVEGDGETYVIIGALYDVVAVPPVSPATGQVAQPGECLIRSGCGVPDDGHETGHTSDPAGWIHLGRTGVFFGMGDAHCAIESDGIVLCVGSVRLTLDGSGLRVTGGDIHTDVHSLNDHVHPYGTGMTGKAIG